MQTRSDEEGRTKVRELIKDIRITLMVTHGADGKLHSRPMSAAGQDEDGTLWFMARKDSVKIEEISQDMDVLLAYSEPKHQHYVSIAGKATPLEDAAKAKALWSEFARTWFPKGPEDPNLCLIRVTPEAAEYWDAPSGIIVYAYGYLKARLTGKSPSDDIANTGHVNYAKQA